MNKTSALRPMGALAASSLLFCTVVMAASAQEAGYQPGADSVGAAVGCQSRLPDNPKTGLPDNPKAGIDLGPLFEQAV